MHQLGVSVPRTSPPPKRLTHAPRYSHSILKGGRARRMEGGKGGGWKTQMLHRFACAPNPLKPSATMPPHACGIRSILLYFSDFCSDGGDRAGGRPGAAAGVNFPHTHTHTRESTSNTEQIVCVCVCGRGSLVQLVTFGRSVN